MLLDLTNRKSPEELKKMPSPSNAGLVELFVGVDKLVIKNGGVNEGKAMSDDELLVVEDNNHIDRIAGLMEINETRIGFYCLCMGDYALEFYAGNVLKATIGLHHEVSMRYDEWNSDVEFLHSEDFFLFLFVLGFEEAWLKRLQVISNMEPDRAAELNWFYGAPSSFKKYKNNLTEIDSGIVESLLNDLRKEFLTEDQLIITLLQLFGRSNDFWNDYPLYEELPNTVLKSLSFGNIINAYLSSDKNYKTRRGLGRFLCLPAFKKERAVYLNDISFEVINDLAKCFQSLKDVQGIAYVSELKEEKLKQDQAAS